MKKLISLALLSFTLNFIAVSAKDYKVEEIPMVHLQDRTRYVSNPDQILSAQTVATIDKMFFDLENATGIQVMVVAVTGIDGGDCFDFAYQLGQKKGVGEKKRDNGLVILLSTDERCIQFVTGYGLEGILPDAICKRIQSRYMLQHFKNDDWDAGMLAGMKAVKGILDGSMEKLEEETDSEDMIAFVIFFGVIGGIILLAIYGSFMNGRCPKCKKRDVLQRISSKVISKKNGIITSEVIYLCSNCGKKVVKIEKTTDHNYRGPRHHNRRIFMGGGGFGGSGGGFSGGSFGGGSFGGGGAGSRF